MATVPENFLVEAVEHQLNERGLPYVEMEDQPKGVQGLEAVGTGQGLPWITTILVRHPARQVCCISTLPILFPTEKHAELDLILSDKSFLIGTASWLLDKKSGGLALKTVADDVKEVSAQRQISALLLPHETIPHYLAHIQVVMKTGLPVDLNELRRSIKLLKQAGQAELVDEHLRYLVKVAREKYTATCFNNGSAIL